MQKNRRNDRIYIINVNNIVYGVIFLLILISIIYFISKGMGPSTLTIQSTGVYEKDQVIAIEAVANNVVGRINNIIAVSAIFFAVIVSSVSVFQFIKIKDLDKINEEIVSKSKEIELDLQKSSDEMILLKNENSSLKLQWKELDRSLIKSHVDLNIQRIEYSLDKLYGTSRTLDLPELINLTMESLELSDSYDGIITNIQKSELIYNLAHEAFIKLSKYDVAESYLRESLNLLNDEECDGFKLNIYTDLIVIAMSRGSEEEIDNLLKEVEGNKDLEAELNESIFNLNYVNDAEKVIELLKEKEYYFGKLFFKKLIENMDKGHYEELLKKEKFIEYVNTLKDKYR
jgi:hypothetical protein